MSETRFTRRAAMTMLGVSAIATPLHSFGQSKPLKKVRIMIAGSNSLNIGYYFLTVPTALDMWREEGLDVELFAAPGGSMMAVQQLVGGGIDFSAMDVSGVMAANTSPAAANLRPLVTTGIIDTSVIVPEDSPIKSMADLKGKSIGIINLSSGGMVLLRSLLSENGMDMEKDVQVLPVGFGASALEALKSDRVQALVFWGSAIVAFENLGMKFRKFSSPEWATLPGYSVVTSQALIDKDPELVEAVARVVAKGLTFSNASPECALAAHWKRYPDTKPTGVDETTARMRDLNVLKFLLSGAKTATQIMGDRGWANAIVGPFARYQNFLYAGGVIKAKVPATSYVIQVPGFFERVNQFDVKNIEAKAKACSV